MLWTTIKRTTRSATNTDKAVNNMFTIFFRKAFAAQNLHYYSGTSYYMIRALCTYWTPNTERELTTAN